MPILIGMDASTSTHAVLDRGGVEQRRERRVVCRRAIEVLPCAADGSASVMQATMLDCSVHGIGLAVGRAMAVGDRFMVKVKLGTMAVVLYTVRNCRRSDPGWRIGA